MPFKEQIGYLLSPLTGLDPEEITSLLEVPPEPGLGSLPSPVTYWRAPRKGLPQVISALSFATKIGTSGLSGKSKSAGPYLNFYINKAHLFSRLLPEITELGPGYGHSNIGQGRTVVIDYSAPNIANSFGIGHLRSTVIGSSLYRLYQAMGYRVVGINHLGDQY